MAVQGRRVLLCVGGGIAAYKSCEVARLLVKAGAQVRVALTPAAQRFVTQRHFRALLVVHHLGQAGHDQSDDDDGHHEYDAAIVQAARPSANRNDPGADQRGHPKSSETRP